MAEQSEVALPTLREIQSIQDFLKTEMSIGEPADGTIKAEIRVCNDAPLANGGSEIVFVGVGLRAINYKKVFRASTPSEIKSLREILSSATQIGLEIG